MRKDEELKKLREYGCKYPWDTKDLLRLVYLLESYKKENAALREFRDKFLNFSFITPEPQAE